jgi:ABC-type branched-subunit amino acid transport system substrate-binding protein
MALAGTYTEFGDSLDPILDSAGLADIGMFPQVGSDYTSKTAFPITSGAIGSVAGMATLVTDVLKSDRLSVPYINVSSGSQIVQLLQGVLQTRPGSKIVTQVAVPETATDMSASVHASTQGNPGGIILVIPGSQDLQFLQTAKSQGVTIPIAEISQSDIAKLGAAADGTYVTTSFPPSGGQGNADFASQMEKYAPNAVQDDLAKNAWLSVWLFANTAKNLPTITRATVLAAMSQVSNYSTGGLTPPLTFTKPYTGFGGTLPRMFNQTVVYTKVVNSKFVATGSGFANPFVPLGG